MQPASARTNLQILRSSPCSPTVLQECPNLGRASILNTKNLSRREWQAEPKALEAIAQEAEGLRRNGTWDVTTAIPLHELRSQTRSQGRKLRVAELMILCGVKHAELAPELRKIKGRIVYRGDRMMDEFNNLVFFEETSTIPTGLIALNS